MAGREQKNMKELTIQSHSWSPFFLLTYLYGENERLWGPLHPFVIYFEKKHPLDHRSNIQVHIGTSAKISKNTCVMS